MRYVFDSSLSRPTSSPSIGVSRSRSPVSYADLAGIQEPPSSSIKAASYTPPRGTPLKNSSRFTSPPSKQEIRNVTHNNVNPLQRQVFDFYGPGFIFIFCSRLCRLKLWFLSCSLKFLLFFVGVCNQDII